MTTKEEEVVKSEYERADLRFVGGSPQVSQWNADVIVLMTTVKLAAGNYMYGLGRTIGSSIKLAHMAIMQTFVMDTGKDSPENKGAFEELEKDMESELPSYSFEVKALVYGYFIERFTEELKELETTEPEQVKRGKEFLEFLLCDLRGEKYTQTVTIKERVKRPPPKEGDEIYKPGMLDTPTDKPSQTNPQPEPPPVKQALLDQAYEGKTRSLAQNALLNMIYSEPVEQTLKENMFLHSIASPNASVVNDCFKNAIGEQIDRKETSKKRKGNTKTYSTVALLDWKPKSWQLLDESGAPLKLLSQHRAVMDIIYSLKVECDKMNKPCIISPAEIYRILTGSDDPNSKVSKGIAGEIDALINTLAACRISVDLEQEMKERGIKGKGQFTRYLIAIDGVLEVTYRNGSKSKGYEIIRPPVLGEYSERTKQITRVPPEMLAFDEERATIERLGIIYYIARRIMQMYNGQAKRIKLEAIVNNTVENAEEITRKKRYMVFTFAEKYLDYLERKGFISAYSIYYEGKKTGGFDVEPTKKQITSDSSKS